MCAITYAQICTTCPKLTLETCPQFQVTEQVENATCLGASDGSIAINVMGGGQAPYTFSWSNQANTANIENLSAGQYTATITDANFCTKIMSFHIVSTVDNIEVNYIVVEEDCPNSSDGQITLSPSGGTSYTYMWQIGGTSNIQSNLTGGNYDVTVTDESGCTGVQTIQVMTENTQCPMVCSVPVSANISFQNPSCSTASDGQINITSLSGGDCNGFYIVKINGALNVNTSTLGNGTYNILIECGMGCTYEETIALSSSDICQNCNLIMNAICN